MESVKLPPRLAKIASLVPPGSRVADVGTDHGLLPIWLLQQGIALSAVATDLRPGPLSRAERNREAAGVGRLRCVLCDGLEGVPAGEADTVVIAGMGGETIVSILRRAPWTAAGPLLLLQPMSRAEELRRALPSLGIAIRGEYLAEDGGRIYPVIAASGGGDIPLSPAELYTGRFDLVSREALFLPMLDALEKKTAAALSGLERSGKAGDAQRLSRMRLLAEELQAMRRRYHAERI